MNRLALYLDAARAVQLRQAVGRARRVVPARWLLAGAPAVSGPSFRALADGMLAEAVPQSAPAPTADDTGTFLALGVERPFVPSREFWTDRSDGLLFLFHLHGFAELPRALVGADAPCGRAFWEGVTTSWLDEFERPELPAWHPYPTSLRVISWTVALSHERWPVSLGARMTASLWRQAHYLRRAVEHDIGGNHVLKNATALVHAGVCLDDGRLLRRGLRVLAQELPQQFPADGGHFERSTSYHREALHGLRQLAELLRRDGRAVPAAVELAVQRATTWSRAVAGPDGRLPLLGDAWEGPAVAERTHEDLTLLADSGHVILRYRGDQLLFDCGPLGPRHLPAHAHAGALAIVAWFDGAPVAVDRGAFAYTGAERDRFRATAAHNTVEVDGRSQCTFWGDFRAARLPAVELGPIRRVGGAVLVSASHDGYRHLSGAPIHERIIVWLPGDGLLVVDRVASGRHHDVRSSLHLDPSAVCRGGRFGAVSITALGGLTCRLITEPHAPWVGTQVSASAFVQHGVVEPGELFGWSLLRAGAAVLDLDVGTVRIRRADGSVLELGLAWPASHAGVRLAPDAERHRPPA